MERIGKEQGSDFFWRYASNVLHTVRNFGLLSLEESWITSPSLGLVLSILVLLSPKCKERIGKMAASKMPQVALYRDGTNLYSILIF